MPITDIMFLDGHSPEEIVENWEQPYALGSWFHAKRIDMIALSQLGELLGVATYEELIGDFKILNTVDSGEVVIMFFPEQLQDRIRSLTDDEIAAVVPNWGKEEKFGGFGTPDSLTSYLRSLREFLNANTGYAVLYLAV